MWAVFIKQKVICSSLLTILWNIIHEKSTKIAEKNLQGDNKRLIYTKQMNL